MSRACVRSVASGSNLDAGFGRSTRKSSGIDLLGLVFEQLFKGGGVEAAEDALVAERAGFGERLRDRTRASPSAKSTARAGEDAVPVGDLVFEAFEF